MQHLGDRTQMACSPLPPIAAFVQGEGHSAPARRNPLSPPPRPPPALPQLAQLGLGNIVDLTNIGNSIRFIITLTHTKKKKNRPIK